MDGKFWGRFRESLWPYILVFTIFLLFLFWPRYEFRAKVASPDGVQAVMLYVKRDPSYILATPFASEWAFTSAYAYLVGADGAPVGRRWSRNCAFLVGAIYNGGAFQPRWSALAVEMGRYSQIDRETGRAECHDEGF